MTEITLGQLIKYKKGKPPVKNDVISADLIPVITPEYLRTGIPSEFTPRQSAHQIMNSNELLLLWDGSNAGEFFRARTGMLGSTMVCFDFDHAITDPTFLYYELKRLEPTLKAKTAGSGIPHVDKEVLLNHRLRKQGKQQQRKIAEVLSTVDRAIEQTEALIVKQQRVKTGLMQDLLTKGIDENGNLRSEETHEFKDSPLGRIPVEWRAGNVADMAHNLDSQRVPIKKTDRTSTQGIYPYYGASGIIDWVDEYLFDGDYVLLGEDGENIISRNLPLAFRASGKIWVNNHAHVFQAKEETDLKFLEIRLEFTDYTPIVIGSDQPKISQSGLSKIYFGIPPHKEQARIAKVISYQEQLLSSESVKLAKMLSLKKGLMQDLLTGNRPIDPLLEEDV